ncbi:hypothetical protein [Rubinisphaera margarita]|uniref:hypothetical protein n=1 Tax=Rubinisphaera margarita TaxID=2909586 RepID=UPI001EE8BD7D|nr:hypothetical protein [Rubinisphaera margarita]MCG6154927.1 hypothetical protein [Rubinisphaera margarita]
MTRLLALFAGILLGGLLMYFSFSYHIVTTGKKTYYVPKTKAQVADFYVDIREWNHQNWAEHPELANAMIKAGHGDLVRRSIAEDLLDAVFRRSGAPDRVRK